MNLKRLIGSILAVFVFICVSNMVIHHHLLGAAYKETAAAWRPEDVMNTFCHWIFIGQAVFSVFFAWIFAKGYEGKGIGEGVRCGLLIAGLLCGGIFVQYGVQPITMTILMTWVLGTIVQNLGAGVLCALIYRK